MTENIQISIDKDKLDFELIFNFLSSSYWGKNYTFYSVKKSVENSLCFGMYFNNKQIGFARVITDYTRLAYLADVFILEEYRGRGLGKMLLEYIFSFPSLTEVGKWMLATTDAAELYAKFGFSTLTNPNKYMEKRNYTIK
jgi:GNAT superfamily N-acetyltransferase